jgi:hypothetical protein
MWNEVPFYVHQYVARRCNAAWCSVVACWFPKGKSCRMMITAQQNEDLKRMLTYQYVNDVPKRALWSASALWASLVATGIKL